MKNCTATFTNYFLFSKRLFLSAFFLISCVLSIQAQWSSHVGLPISYWDFENNTTRTTLETTVEQQINSGNTFDGKFGGISTTVSRAAGAGLDIYSGTADGSAMRAGGWSSSSSAGTGITTYYQFTINTTGFTGIRLNFDAFVVDGGILVGPSFGVTYSTDGGATYTNVGSQTTLDGWYTDNVFALGSTANNLSNLKVRIYGYWSDNSTTSTLAIDNLLFTATALATSAGIKTSLNEANIYTSYKSGSTGSFWIRYGTFTITSGSTLNMGSAIFVGSSSTAGAVTVNSGGTLDCGSGGAQTLSTGTSGLSTFTLNTGGTIVIRSTSGISVAGTASGNIQTTTRNYGAGGHYTYTHPSGSTQQAGNGLPASISGNLTINNNVTQSIPSLTVTGTTNFTAGIFSIAAGNALTLGGPVVFGTGTLGGTATSDLTINGSGSITGNIVFTAAAQNLSDLTYSRAVTATLGSNLTVNSNFNLTAGTFVQNSGTNVFGLTVIGDFNLSGGTYNFHSGTTQSTLTLRGNFVHTGGSTTTSGSLNGIVLFNKAGTQTFSSSAPTTLLWIQETIASGTTLQLLTNMHTYGSSSFPSACQVNGILDAGLFTVTSQSTGCTFSLNSLGSLITANPNGVFSGTIGSVSSSFSTRTFNSNANYTFNGTAAQTTNFVNATMRDLTVNNSAGVSITASSNPVVNGTTTLTLGSLSIGTNTLTLSGPITTTTGTLGGTTSSNLTVNGTGTITGNVSFTTGALQLNNFLLSRTGTTFILGTNLSIAGNWTNNGTFNVNAKVITFNGTSNQIISGSSATAFAALTINAGTSIATVVDATGAGGGAISNTGTLTLTNGLYRLTASNASAFRSGSLTIAATAGLELNGGSFSESAGTLTCNGLFRIISGTASVGTASGNALDCSATGTLDLQGGSLSVAARMRNIGGQINISGTNVTLNTVALSNSARAVLEMDAASNFNWSAGNIILQGVNASSGGEVNIASGAGTKTVSGGTLQFGNATSASGLTFRCNSAIDLYNVTMNSTNSPSVSLLTNNLTVKNQLSLNGGNITTGALAVVIPTGGSVLRNSGHVNGNLRKGFSAGSGQLMTFETGDATQYAPIDLSNLDVTSAGFISAFTLAGTNPSENSPIANSSGINQSARANRYWTLNPSGGLGMNTTDATFNFGAAEASGSTSLYVVRKYLPAVWTTTNAGSMTSTSSTATGLTALGEFEAGEVTAAPGITCPSDITQCDNTTPTWSPTLSGSPVPDLVCTPSSGSTFATGTTPVNCSVTNINGSANCSFNVTINTSPVLSACPSNIVQCDNHVASWIDPTATGEPAPPVVCVPSSGSTFATGTTTVTCTATNLCSSSSCAFSVTINESSVDPVSASSNASYGQICIGSNVTLTVNGGSLGTGASWNWYDGGCGTGAPVGSGASITITPAIAGLHTYYVRAEGACGNSSCASVAVNVITAPPAGTVHYTSTFNDGCVGAPATAISVNAVSGAAFYRWTSAQAGVRFNGNPSPFETTVPTVNVTFVSLPASGSSGWSICSFAGNACGNTNTVCSWVRATVSMPSVISGSVIGCPSSNGNPYSVAAVSGAVSYQWSGTGGIVINNNGSQNVLVDFPAGFVSGTLSVHGQTSCGYNGPDRTFVISANPGIPGNITGASYPCPNASSAYSIAPVPGAASYTWSTSVAGAIVTGTTTSCSIQFPAVIPAGSTVSVFANTSCPTSGAVRSKGIATGIPNVPANINGLASGQCGQSGVSYSINPVPLATSYSWNVTCGTLVGPVNLSAVSVDWPSSFTACTLSVSAINSCGTSAPRILGVFGAPAIPPAISGNAAPCAGSVEVYSTTGSIGATSYSWVLPAGAVILGPTNGATITVLWGATGGNVTVRASNDCGNSAIRTLACTISCRLNQVNSSVGFNAEVFPNPATYQTTVQFNAEASSRYRITMTNIIGETQLVNEGESKVGLNIIDMNLSEITRGIYLVTVEMENYRWQGKLTVQ